MTADLILKPDIGAPGGLIRSTYPLEQGAYATISGTSMASPHVAGAAALLKQARPGLAASAFRAILQNSADPKNWSGGPALGFLDFVHRQGAGMVDVDDAIASTTTVTPGKLSFGEGSGGSGTLSIANASSSAQTYAVSHVTALSTGPVATQISPFGFGVFLGYADPHVQLIERDGSGGRNGLARCVDRRRPGEPPGPVAVRRLHRADPPERRPGLPRPVRGLPGRLPVDRGDADPGPLPGDRQGDRDQHVLDRRARPRCGRSRAWTRSRTCSSTSTTRCDAWRSRSWTPRRGLRCTRCSPTCTSRTTCRGTRRRPGSSRIRGSGGRLHSNGQGSKAGLAWKTVPDGQYKLIAKALKALGDSSTPSDWETWTSPTITIDRP